MLFSCNHWLSCLKGSLAWWEFACHSALVVAGSQRLIQNLELLSAIFDHLAEKRFIFFSEAVLMCPFILACAALQYLVKSPRATPHWALNFSFK